MDTVDYPVLFRDADEASLAGQRRYVWLVRTDLICVVSAAVLGVVGSLVNGQSGTIVVLATVVVLLGAFTARLVNRILRDERAWFDGRALAESAKSLTWQFVMRAGPFKVDDEAAERRFIGDLWDLRRERKDLRLSSSQADENVGQITSKMQEIRAQDLQARRIVYLTERAGDQMSWYRSKVQANQRGAFLWFGVGIVAQVLALAAAAARLVLPPSLNLIGLFSSIAAAAMAWTQLRRHDELTRGYALAADELLTLQELIQRAKDEDEFAKLVDESEGAISREHKMWVAKRA